MDPSPIPLDADPLDLLRVGIRPDPKRLLTDAARDPEVLVWAMERSGRPWWRG